MDKPKKENTTVCNGGREWRPKTVADFFEEVRHLTSTIDEAFLFRGHRQSDWLLDSTFARSLKSLRGVKTTERYPEELRASVSHQHECARIWLQKHHSLQLSQELQQFRSQGVDVYFEYYRHQQHNPYAPRLADTSPCGTNFIDFSSNWEVALYFANLNRGNEEGSLFLVRQTALGAVFYRGSNATQEIADELEKWLAERPKEMYGHLPLMIVPEKQLNNTLDPKANRQEAIYLMQTDFRADLELSWELMQESSKKQVFVKLILPPNSHDEVQAHLTTRGITDEYLFPKTIFDRQEI
jgi:hypothetical protein